MQNKTCQLSPPDRVGNLLTGDLSVVDVVECTEAFGLAALERSTENLMNKNVFISVGRTVTEEQEAFVKALEEHIRSQGLIPRAVGRTDFSSSHPLKFIQKLMNDCAGTVVIAFERVKVIDGLERRGSVEEKALSNQVLTTVWNQIEAAMAYVLGHPLLVIVEEGSRGEGLLEAGYDWYVQHVELAPSVLNSKQFVGVFADWKDKVDTRASQRRKVDVENLTISEILGSIKPAQLWAMLGALGAVIAGTAALTKYFG